MLNCRWQAIEPRGVTAWEATHSVQRSLVGDEIRVITLKTRSMSVMAILQQLHLSLSHHGAEAFGGF